MLGDSAAWAGDPATKAASQRAKTTTLQTWVIAALTLVLIGLAPTTSVAAQADVPVAPTQTNPRNYAFAVIGDTPYSNSHLAEFPSLRREINRRKRIEFAVHVGDIKNGRSPCTDQYFATIKTQFDRFTKPLLYTPGDNEWTDCHRFAAGAYDPLERLAKVREVFFANPTQSLGSNPYPVQSQGVVAQRHRTLVW